ncbi:MAG: YkgJ family cysteine cluster protein [Pseudomonas sp.]
MSADNPCMTCGACCAHFRVSFYWAECQSAGGCVPDAVVEQISPHLVALRGTTQKPVRCINLRGEVGHSVSCSCYDQRPSPCREFECSWAHGRRYAQCDAARAAYGLPPLPAPMSSV